MTWNLSHPRRCRQPGRRAALRCHLEKLENRRLLDGDAAITVDAPGQTSIPEWWVDTDIAGNTATSVGTIQRCRRIEEAVSFQVDVVVFNAPAFGGFHLAFHFDSTYAEFVGADPTFLLTSAGGELEGFEAAQPVPGMLVLGAVLKDPGPEAAGSGVLVRLTFGVKNPQGQSGFDVNPALAGLNRISGELVPSDPDHARAAGIIDSTAKVGCWTVNSADDDADVKVGDGIADADPALGIVKTTLRAAVAEANAIAGPNRISFRIPDAGGAVAAPPPILVNSPLPPLQDPDGGTTIDGRTQPGVVVKGTFAGAGADGFRITTAGNSLLNLTINGFAGAGVRVSNVTEAPSNHISGCRIGTDATGNAAVPNGTGVVLHNTRFVVLGGPTAEHRNIISGNTGNGLELQSGATENSIFTNHIGTNAAADAAVPNGRDGVLLENSPENFIGGLADQPGGVWGNVISGNTGAGLRIRGGTGGKNRVWGNAIGMNAAGDAKLPNATGVVIDGAPRIEIGGVPAGRRNLISGNEGSGVQITGAGARDNTVINNFIGTDRTGMVTDPDGVPDNGDELGNSDGVRIDDAPWNEIGGTDAAKRNVIAGNFLGVFIRGGGARNNKVWGNFVGTNVEGNSALGNHIGVRIEEASENLVGDVTDGNPGRPPGNVISGNTLDGVQIVGTSDAPARGNTVRGNLIGTKANGTEKLPNAADGVYIVGGSETDSASGNVIGGDRAGGAERNIISGNGDNGVFIWSAHGNFVQSNYIGMDRTGTQALGNDENGVYLLYARNNLIGGTPPAAGTPPGNVISANGQDGILIDDLLSDSDPPMPGNRIQGNVIGTDWTGRVTDPDGAAGNGDELGNDLCGVHIDGARGTWVGGLAAGQRNIIAGNGLDAEGADEGNGITIEGPTAQDNQVLNNFIGTDITGGHKRANHGDGVLILDSPFNTIGGMDAAARNVLSGNRGNGIRISGDDAHDNTVRGNAIGTQAVGPAPLGNGENGVLIEDNASDNIIGGRPGGPRSKNSIANNKNGVVVGANCLRNSIDPNGIFDNRVLGIDLGNDGVTPNDPGDGDMGANELQNFPDLSLAETSGGVTVVRGRLQTTPGAGQTYTLEFFASALADPSGHGEGELFLGATTVTTDTAGSAEFSASFTSVAVGHFITVTATDPDNNTSEFSRAQVVTAGDPGSAPLAPQPVVVRVGGGSFRFRRRPLVDRVTIQFSGSVLFEPGAIEIRHQRGRWSRRVGLNISIGKRDGKTVATLSLAGRGRRLADGMYTLIVRGDKVHDSLGRRLDGNSDGLAGGDFAARFRIMRGRRMLVGASRNK